MRIFCGTQVPEKIEYKVRDIFAAGNRFQNNMIANLKKCGHEVTECAYIGAPVPEEIRELQKNNTVFKSKGFLGSILEYRRLVRKLLSDNETVMCYNITYAWVFLPFWVNKKKKRSIAIIADYSEAVSLQSFLGKCYAGLQGFSMRHFDIVIGLSANIKDRLVAKQRFILMEGGIDRSLYDSFEYTEHMTGASVTFLYSGLLSPVTGVDKLLDAMMKVKNSAVRLLLFGKGDLEDRVKQSEKEDDRIHYLGYLPYEEYVKQLQSADVLLNPRSMELPENRNNFPSKVMDYLAAGKQIISTKFVGWERFSEHIVFCDSYSDMVEKIEAVSLEKQKEIFDENRAFAKEFLWTEQIRRILQ